AHLLGHSGDYRVRLGDAQQHAVDLAVGSTPATEGLQIDFASDADLDRVLEGAAAVISCAPFHCNPRIAARAKAAGVHYLDLTEDVEVTRHVQALAEGAATAFVPQCGLAPGFILICALYHLEG